MLCTQSSDKVFRICNHPGKAGNMVTKILRSKVAITLIAMIAIANLVAEDHDHDHGKETKGPHGGPIHELRDAGDTHVEVIHDKEAGSVAIHLLGKDMKTPAVIKESPKINLRAKDGNKQIEMKPVAPADGKASHFEATNEALKGEPLTGRISITLDDGKKYNVKLESHGHDHE